MDSDQDLQAVRVLDLFSGIGGFSLGLERAGMETVAFCEFDKKARLVLEKHWPGVPIFEDIKELTYEKLKHLYPIDLICGGFPCQDISLATTNREGIQGRRSGLWSEYARIIGEIRPQYVVVENVTALLGGGLSTVLRDLAQIGYDAEWHCIPATYVGAPHRRDRVWIIAYPNGNRLHGHMPYRCFKKTTRGEAPEWRRYWNEVGAGYSCNNPIPPINERGVQRCVDKPYFYRVAHGVPNKLDRLKQLGNAVVPQIVEMLGRAIMEAEKEL